MCRQTPQSTIIFSLSVCRHSAALASGLVLKHLLDLPLVVPGKLSLPQEQPQPWLAKALVFRLWVPPVFSLQNESLYRLSSLPERI